MRRILAAIAIAFVGLSWTACPSYSQEKETQHQLGIGAHYWTSVKNIDFDNVDENGFSYSAMYQFHYGWVGIEAAVEWFKKGFAGSTEDVYQPQAFLLLGKVIYVGAGIGGYYSDGDWADDPFYALRAGLDIPVLPFLHLDINANYRFEDLKDFSDKTKRIDTDTVTLGAAARLVF